MPQSFYKAIISEGFNPAVKSYSFSVKAQILADK